MKHSTIKFIQSIIQGVSKQGEIMQRSFLIDAGHGGKDPGAVSVNGTQEKDITLAVSRKVFGILQALGFRVSTTRVGDVYPTLQGRCDLEHELAPDAFISLHCNAAVNRQAKGIEVWTSPGDTAADPLAVELFKSLQRTFPARKYRTDMADGDEDKEGNFCVLKHTFCPAVLIEMGFVSNAAEGHWLSDEGNQNRMALAIVDGLLAWGSA